MWKRPFGHEKFILDRKIPFRYNGTNEWKHVVSGGLAIKVFYEIEISLLEIVTGVILMCYGSTQFFACFFVFF